VRDEFVQEFARARHVQVRGLAAALAELAGNVGAAIRANNGVVQLEVVLHSDFRKMTNTPW